MEDEIKGESGPVEDNPGSQESLLIKAWACRNASQLDVALGYFEEAVAINPDAASICGLASTLLMAGYDQEAEYTLINYLETNTGDVETLVYLGNFLIERKRIADAISALEKAISVNADSADAHIGLGRACQELNDYPRATRYFREAVRINPESVTAHLLLAGRLTDSGDTDAVMGEFGEILKRDPDNVDALMGMSNQMIEQGAPQDALKHLERAVSLQPDNAEIHALIAKSHDAQGRLEESLARYKQATALAPRNIDIFHNYALMVHLTGNSHDALHMLQDYRGKYGVKTGLLGLEASLLAHVGDERVHELLDYDRLLRESMLEVPNGYDSMESFTGKLSEAVLAHPTLTPSPRSHATRNGKHTGNLFIGGSDIFTLLEQQVRENFVRYVNDLSVSPDHPVVKMRSANVGSVGWAVVMDKLGHQIPHIHPGAWLSGVCYLQLPDIIREDDTGHAGWIEFGPAPDYYKCDTSGITIRIKPELGKLILFPSYFFHNTVPFESSIERISLAFDVITQ